MVSDCLQERDIIFTSQPMNGWLKSWKPLIRLKHRTGLFSGVKLQERFSGSEKEYLEIDAKTCMHFLSWPLVKSPPTSFIHRPIPLLPKHSEDFVTKKKAEWAGSWCPQGFWKAGCMAAGQDCSHLSRLLCPMSLAWDCKYIAVVNV